MKLGGEMAHANDVNEYKTNIDILVTCVHIWSPNSCRVLKRLGY